MVATRTPSVSSALLHSETGAERDTRIARELEIIERAEAALEAGLGIDGKDLETWLDALDQDENTPLPLPTGQKLYFR